MGDGNTADIDSIEDSDLDTEVVYFEGQRLTGAQAQAIGQDIAARHGRKGGRPMLDYDIVKNRNITLLERLAVN